MEHSRFAWLAVLPIFVLSGSFVPRSWAQSPVCKPDKTIGLFEAYPIAPADLRSGQVDPEKAGLIPQGNAHSSLHLNPVGHMYFSPVHQVCTQDLVRVDPNSCTYGFDTYNLFAPADLEIDSVYHWDRQGHDYVLTRGSPTPTHVDYDMYTIGLSFTCSVSGYLNGVTDLNVEVDVTNPPAALQPPYKLIDLVNLYAEKDGAGNIKTTAWNAHFPQGMKIKISKGQVLGKFTNYDAGIDFGIKDQRSVNGRTVNLAWNRELEFLHHRPFLDYYSDPVTATAAYSLKLPQYHQSPGPWRQDHPESLQGLWFSKPLIDHSLEGNENDRNIGERGTLTIEPYFFDSRKFVLAWGAEAPSSSPSGSPTPTPAAILDPAKWNASACANGSTPRTCDLADQFPVAYAQGDDTYAPAGLQNPHELEFTWFIAPTPTPTNGTVPNINPPPALVTPATGVVCYELRSAYKWNKNGSLDFSERHDYVLIKVNAPSRPGIYDQSVWVRYFPLGLLTSAADGACQSVKTNGTFANPPADELTPGLWRKFYRGIKPQTQAFQFPVDLQSAFGAAQMGLANPAKGDSLPDFSDLILLQGWNGTPVATDVKAMAAGAVFLIEKRITSTRTLYDVYVKHPNSTDHTTYDGFRPGLVTVTKDLDSIPFDLSQRSWVSAEDFNTTSTNPTAVGRYWMMLDQPAGSAINAGAAAIPVTQGATIGQAHRSIRVSVIDQSATNGAFFYPSKMRYAGLMDIWGSYAPLAALNLTAPYTPSASPAPSTLIGALGLMGINRFPIAHHTESGDIQRPYWYLGNPHLNAFSIYDYLPPSTNPPAANDPRQKLMGYSSGMEGTMVPGLDQSDKIIGSWFSPALDGNEYPSIDAHAGALSFWYNRWSSPGHLEPLVAFGVVDSVQVAANKGLAQLDPTNRPDCLQGQSVETHECIADHLTWDKRRFRSGSSYSVNAQFTSDGTRMYLANPDLRKLKIGDVACFDLRPESNMMDEDQDNEASPPSGYDVLWVHYKSERELKALLIPLNGAANESCGTRIISGAPLDTDSRWKSYQR